MNFLLFLSVSVILFNFSHGFHAKLLVRKDGSISSEGLQGYSNFEKSCIKDDYCTYSLKAPGISPTDYSGDQNRISKDGQDFEGDQDAYNQKMEDYQNFESKWKVTSGQIDSMLLAIESINKQLPSILDSIENSLENATQTYTKIETAIGEISNPCYLSTCASTTVAPPMTTQNAGSPATDVTSAPGGSTPEPETTQSQTPFTGSTPTPGPTEPAGSTTTGATEAPATGGSTDGSVGTTVTDSGSTGGGATADGATTAAGGDSTSSEAAATTSAGNF